MASLLSIIKTTFGIGTTSNAVVRDNQTKDKIISTIPGGRRSINSENRTIIGDNNNRKLRESDPEFLREAIPFIRRQYKVNSDLGLAVYDAVQLINTGHNISFGHQIKADQANLMEEHLIQAGKSWGDGVAGIHGLVNKMIAQIMVGGSLSIEKVIDRKYTGIENIVFINAEEIVFKYSSSKSRYYPYQRATNGIIYGTNDNLIKLNPHTYSYYGLFSDTNKPYGIPPFITAIEALDIQKDMNTNIAFIMDQMGLMGFLQVLLEKPLQKGNQREDEYIATLNNLLETTKNNIKTGLKDGILVGYEEDHEFKFQSTTQNLSGVLDIYKLNQQRLANGLKTPGQFLGLNSGTEGFGSVVFTKMISQLRNVQEILETFLADCYLLELKLAGFKVNEVKVEFNKSTITDELKDNQSLEIKQRISRALFQDGIISQETYAKEMGYSKPDQKEPRVDPNAPAGGVDPQTPEGSKKKADREADKDKSDRKGRDKDKPQPKRKDGDSKTR